MVSAIIRLLAVVPLGRPKDEQDYFTRLAGIPEYLRKAAKLWTSLNW